MYEIVPLKVGEKPWEDIRKMLSILSTKRGVLLLRDSLPCPLPKVREPGLIFLLTSGSGGTPKVVAHSLSGLLKSARRTLDFYGVSRGDCWPLNLPLYHVAGLQIVFRSLLAKTPLTRESVGGTVLSLVPAMLPAMLEDPAQVALLKKMKAVLVGGAPLSAALWERARTLGIPLSPTYGMTETGSQVAALSPADFLAGERGMQVLPGARVSLVNGTLAVGGDSLMKGYLSEDGTIEAPMEGGLFLTSDTGTLEGGRLRVGGRRDRVIISGGENIDPARLERLALEHPHIRAAAALGLPDERWGERVHLAYVGERDLDLAELKNFLRDDLPRWHLPKEISRHGTLPGGVLKVDYQALRESLA